MVTPSGWKSFIQQEQQKPYYQQLRQQILAREAQGAVIYPPKSQIFTAFKYADIHEINVVILGQDPYHGEGQAHGLAFSVLPGVKVPPSLANIYKELAIEFSDFQLPNHGCLTHWAEQGVMLLNNVLTVEKASAHAHAGLGWEIFTDAAIEIINQQNDGCVFMLWGSPAQKKGQKIDENKHLVLKSPHPSPLSAYRGFFGCNHFIQANQWLEERGKTPIHWQV
jgi:uracil-DNA glycosylase